MPTPPPTKTTPPLNDALNTSNYLCIGCPLGCRLEVDETPFQEIVEVRGFSCKRGETYAKQEHVAPQRMVTTTVAVVEASGRGCRCAPRSPFLKTGWWNSASSCIRLKIAAPIEIGQVILANVLGTDADVIASRSMPAAKQAK
jgi:CxxC motif-containing protein